MRVAASVRWSPRIPLFEFNLNRPVDRWVDGTARERAEVERGTRAIVLSRAGLIRDSMGLVQVGVIQADDGSAQPARRRGATHTGWRRGGASSIVHAAIS